VVPGLAAGLLAALTLAPLLRGLLYGVGPQDPRVLAAVAFAMVTLASAAVLVPALRAAAVDPAQVLREE
ncbi:MAG: hypothetical protein OEO23_15005, partial [Gemmatimonadota bacterium]|nr:hypothetical protein [Gemmatimonadota bacterium]